MISGIQGNDPGDIARSVQAMQDVLVNAQAQSMQMAEKLMKTGIQQAIQDTQLGTLIDVMA
jgi:hypothetical protein